LLSRVILHCRQNHIDKLLFDSTGLPEFRPPALADQYNLAERIASEAESMVKIAHVADPEWDRLGKFSLTVAKNRGLEAKRFHSAATALTWLLKKQSTPSSRSVLHTGKFLTLHTDDGWEYVDRIKAAGAAVIIGVTSEQKLLLVEQYRIPVHALTIELPAGLIGDEPQCAGESSLAAARRELLEETGYSAERLEMLTTGPSCSGITSERVTFFRAFDLHRTGNGGGVANEDITVHEIPLVGVEKWLEAKASAGVLIDPKIYAGLFFLAQSR
jgi:ADP-ribose pyrophosphatase